MTIAAIRTALAAAVGSAEIVVGGLELTAYSYTPDSVEVPCFYVGEIESIEPNVDYGGVTDQIVFVCRILASTNDDQAGLAAVDALLERDGPTSVRAPIFEAAGAPGQPALGGACDDLSIVSVRGHRRYTVGDDIYYGAEIRIMTIGAGTG